MATIPLTVVLNLQSLAMPQIANPIRVDVSTQANPLTIVATETDTIPLHPERTWSFPGLPRTNYLVEMWEVNTGGTKLNRLAHFDVVPNSLYTMLVRNDEQLKVDVTPGLISGQKNIMFDGGETAVGSGLFRPDFRGWNINPERRNAGGTMVRGQEYSWNQNTGNFELLLTGDVFLALEPYNIDFDPQQQPAGGSVPTNPAGTKAFTNKLITSNYTVKSEDLGNNLIVEPSSNYMEITFPAASTMSEGLPVSISVHKTSMCCVKLVTTIVNPWGGSIFLLPGESIEVYCFVRSTGNNEWRYIRAFGNFGRVGTNVYSDNQPLNSIPALGATMDIYTHARLWQYINTLGASQKVPYSSWATNQTFFSLNSGNNFHVPNRGGLWAKCGISSDVAGTFLPQQLAKHKHIVPWGESTPTPPGAPFGRTNQKNKQGSGDTDNDNDHWYTNDGTELSGALQLNPAGLIGDENRPNSFLINQYILL